MNDMRKLMEAVEDLEEMPGRSRSSHEKFFDKRHPSEVLQFFGSKRRGGKIKDGYEAWVPFDDETRQITSISIAGDNKNRIYHVAGYGGISSGRSDWSTYSLDDVKIYKITKEQVL